MAILGRELVNRIHELMSSGDMDALVDLYAEDVVAIPPDHPDLHGREAVAAGAVRVEVPGGLDRE